MERLSYSIKVLLMEIFYWFGWSFVTYQTVYLQNNGMDSSYIGVLNALCSVVAIIAMTVWGMVSDKLNSVKLTFIICLVMSTVLYGIIGFLPTGVKFASVMFLIYFPIMNFAKGSICTLHDNFTVRICTEKGVNYGGNRAIGSLAYTLGCLLLSFILVPKFTVKYTFIMYLIASVPCLIVILTLPNPMVVKKKRAKLNPKELFKNYHYVTFLIFMVIAYIPLNCEFGFISYLMEARNISLDNFGLVSAIRALTEVPILLCINRLRNRFKLKYILLAGIGILAVESVSTALFSHDLISVTLITSLIGFGNGIIIGTTSHYLYKLAPEELKATAHTFYGAATAGASFIGYLAGGFVFKFFGATRFYLSLFCMYMIAIIFFSLSIALYKKTPNPADD